MSAESELLFRNASLAQAAYANLDRDMSGNQLVQELTQSNRAGMSIAQATNFAATFNVIDNFDDTANSGFSVTVFTQGSEVSIAIRGTDNLFGDDLQADSDILSSDRGAAYQQILTMYNWWLRESAEPETSVPQYELMSFQQGDQLPTEEEGALAYIEQIPGQNEPDFLIYLVHASPADATGELFDAINSDANGINVVGHSLGGHLAMAFNSLVNTAKQVVAFNAPGFLDSANNRGFFEFLGGHLPSGLNDADIEYVISNQAEFGDPGWSAVAGFRFDLLQLGKVIYVPIENQLNVGEPDRPDALNHSQLLLTDSLAVFNLLTKLKPSLSSAEYDSIFQAASNHEFSTLEQIVRKKRRTPTQTCSLLNQLKNVGHPPKLAVC